MINAANRFCGIDFPRPSPKALHSFSTAHALLMPLWWAAVEKPWFLFFLLDVGDGLFGSVCSGALASAGAASRQGSRMETNENGAVLAALDGGAVVWRTGVRSKKTKDAGRP